MEFVMCERIDLKVMQPSQLLLNVIDEATKGTYDGGHLVINYHSDSDIFVMDVEAEWHNDMECPFYDTKYSLMGETVSVIDGRVTQWSSDYPGEPQLITKKEVTK